MRQKDEHNNTYSDFDSLCQLCSRCSFGLLLQKWRQLLCQVYHFEQFWVNIKENLYSSRELKCSCKSFDSSTYGKERLSEIIKKNVNLDSPPNNPKVTHILLQQCENLDLLLDVKYLDPDQYDVNVLSFVSTPELKLEFNQPRQSSLKLVVQDSLKTVLKGTLEENQNNIEMFFRQVGSANFRRSEVIFENFFSRSSIHLLNFINIGQIIVDGSSIQRIDNFDARDPTNCFKIADDNSRVRVNCTKQELFYDNIRSHFTVNVFTLIILTFHAQAFGNCLPRVD